MKTTLMIGSTPYGEDCVQVSSHTDYLPAMKAECERFKQMLIDRFKFGDQCLVRFVITRHQHDFGPYLEVEVEYDDSNPLAEQQAMFVETNCPETWLDTSPAYWQSVEA